MPITGSCLCGGVKFTINGPLRDVIACHCSQCRKTSGNFGAFAQAQAADYTFSADKSLKWYRSSDEAERGFCATCGSNLFWKPTAKTTMSVAAGALDGATGLKTTQHIFVSDKGDFYELPEQGEKLAKW